MADIKSLYGNPLHDGLAVHFSADGQGNPVYPAKASNLIVGTDGSVAFGSADEKVLAEDKGVIYATMKWRETDGGAQNATSRMGTLQYIPLSAEKIVVTDITVVEGIEILAWTSEGVYIGTWNGTTWGTAEKYFTEIPLSELVEEYPIYKYRLNVKYVTGTDIYSVGDYIKWAYKPIDYVKKTADNLDGLMLFDSSSIIIIDSTAITGANGDALNRINCVATDFVDVSNRIDNTIQFNGSITANPIGFAIYDKGKNYISGMWGNNPSLADYGLVSAECPQRITWTLPDNAYYVRACMRKEWYSEPSDFNFVFYVANKGNKANENYDRNFISIAHKGYGGSKIADTLQAFIDAAEAGFRAVEIDCRKTSDGVYCVSHNASIALYSGGTSASYTIESSNWADLKGKTIDSAGLYPIPTLASVFNSLRKYKMDYFVIDLKTGSNDEIMQIARRCGVAEQVMLSYYSMTSFIADLATVQKYPNIAVRFTPNGTQAQWEQIRNAIPNMLFTDVNISDGGANGYFPKSFTWGIPILCSGVQESTKDRMSPVAAGAMSQTTLQYSPKDFLDMVALDYNQFPILTPSANSISLSGTESATVTVASNIDDPACWAYAYSSDLNVCDVYQNTFGANASIKVTGVSAGAANLIVFTASGEQLTIPVNVT